MREFPYVNGQLFTERLPIADFDRQMRETLLECCALDWSRISPAVLGSLFQSIMSAENRRAVGAHYTTETHILRLIRPLFLDDLWAEFERVKGNVNKLFEFQKRLGQMRFLDPACGCGNFLVIAYRELRLLELAVLRHVAKSRQLYLNIFEAVRVNVDQFFGIEIDEWPSRIAEVALWLTDHQMNMQVSEEFGLYFARLPLVSAPHIVCANALRIDWADVVPPEKLNFILGNPPFVGKHYQSQQQKSELVKSFHGLKCASDLDFVASWYAKSAEYMFGNKNIRAALVSTNSLTMGEQVGILWPYLFNLGVNIHFAHRTFQWTSEARGKAAVHCVIIGFGLSAVREKFIFDYETASSDPHTLKVDNVNPYLVDAPNIVVQKRQKPIFNVPIMRCGNKPSDGGYLLLNREQMEKLVHDEPGAASYIKKFIGSEEFLNGIDRYCLWLEDIAPDNLRKLPLVLARVNSVREFREKSTAEPTRKAADYPGRFFFVSQPKCQYILIPEVSSERRRFIPVGLLPENVISSNTNYLLPSAEMYHFGVLQSTMHMAWTRAVCGRLKSDYRYSASIVYNNFPWPDPTPAQKEKIEVAAQAVLDARAQFPTATLADLYDPLTMPPALLSAHRRLDAAVDAAYGRKSFDSESTRVAFLFDLYVKLTEPLVGVNNTKRKKAKNNEL